MYNHADARTFPCTLKLRALCAIVAKHQISCIKIIDTIFVDYKFNQLMYFSVRYGIPTLSNCHTDLSHALCESAASMCNVIGNSQNALLGNKARSIISIDKLTALEDSKSILPLDVEYVQSLGEPNPKGDYSLYKIEFDESSVNVYKLSYYDTNWLERRVQNWIYEQQTLSILDSIKSLIRKEYGNHSIRGTLTINIYNLTLWIHDMSVTVKSEYIRSSTPYSNLQHSTLMHPIFDNKKRIYNRNSLISKSFVSDDKNTPAVHVKNLSLVINNSPHNHNYTIESFKRNAKAKPVKKIKPFATFYNKKYKPAPEKMQPVESEIHPPLTPVELRPKTANTQIEVHVPIINNLKEQMMNKTENSSFITKQQPDTRIRHHSVSKWAKPLGNLCRPHTRSVSCSFTGRKVYNNVWVPHPLPPHVYSSYMANKKASKASVMRDMTDDSNRIFKKATSNDHRHKSALKNYSNIHLCLYRRADLVVKKPKLLGRRAFLLVKGNSQTKSYFTT